MKITDRLAADHKSFRKFVADIDDVSNQPPPARDMAKVRKLVRLFKNLLILHAWFEDKFYYPVVSDELKKRPHPVLSPVYMAHLDHEHRTLDGYAAQLETMVFSDPPARSWPQTFALLAHGLKSHMKNEEENLFPISEQLLGVEKLEELSNESDKHRMEAPVKMTPEGI